MPKVATIKYPEMRELALVAFNKSGCRTHHEFVELFGEAIGLSTFRKWIGGTHPGSALGKLVLREFIDGWRPGERKAIRKEAGRAAELMEYAATMIARECSDATLLYDGVTCDGTCLHDDLNAQAEYLRSLACKA